MTRSKKRLSQSRTKALQGKGWNYFRARLLSRWPALTEKDLHRIFKTREDLVEVLIEAYSLNPAQVGEELRGLEDEEADPIT